MFVDTSLGLIFFESLSVQLYLQGTFASFQWCQPFQLQTVHMLIVLDKEETIEIYHPGVLGTAYDESHTGKVRVGISE